MNLPKHIRDNIRFQPTLGRTACWIWTGYLSHGYPAVSVKGAQISASRHIYGLAHHKDIQPRTLQRLCPTKLCVNPNHYETKDQQ